MAVHDNRKSLDEIHKASELLTQYGFKRRLIEVPEDDSGSVNVLVTETGGKTLWVLAGIHGEEPAGPCAFTETTTTDELKKLLYKDVPMVVVPVCNPRGYTRGERFPDGPDTGHGV